MHNPGKASFQGPKKLTVLLSRFVLLDGQLASNNCQTGSDAGSKNADFLSGQEDTDRAGKDSHQSSRDGSPEDDRCISYELGDHLHHLSFTGVTHCLIAPTSMGTAWLDQGRSHDVTSSGLVEHCSRREPLYCFLGPMLDRVKDDASGRDYWHRRKHHRASVPVAFTVDPGKFACLVIRRPGG